MTVLVDSWAWIEYFKGSAAGLKAKKIIEGGGQLLVATINLSEIFGFLMRNRTEEAEKLIQFVLGCAFAIPLESETALRAAKIKNKLKIGLADAIVIATSEENNAKILTGDDDFKSVENVIYIGK